MKAPLWKPHEDAQVRAGAEAGMTSKQLGAQLGRSPTGVQQRARALGVKLAYPSDKHGTRAAALRLLTEHGPMGLAELEVLVGVSRNTIQRAVSLLNDNGQVYIQRWERQSSGGCPSPIFAAGAKKDAPRPKAFTPMQRHYRYIAVDPAERKLNKAVWMRAHRARQHKPARTDVAAAWIAPTPELEEEPV